MQSKKREQPPGSPQGSGAPGALGPAARLHRLSGHDTA